MHACVCSQSCPTVCDPMDYNPSGSSVHGICQARTLDCHFLLQGIFPTQASNLSPANPALQVDSLPLSHRESPKYSWHHQEIPGRHSRHFRFPGHWLIFSVDCNVFSLRAYDLKIAVNYGKLSFKQLGTRNSSKSIHFIKE